MTLAEELSWRGFVYQHTFQVLEQVNSPSKFYFGVDPSADSMTVGNLAMVMMLRHFIRYGYQAVLLVGGATGLIGDPDGKHTERGLQSKEVVANNKQRIANQYKKLLSDQPFEQVDNYDWFKDFNYLDFLREVGKHVPMRQMLAREFVQSRISEGGNGISYAEFSYVLIQAYDFLYLHDHHQVTLQLCGSDQWGNSVAGVDLIRRMRSKATNVWSAPLVVNPATGIKFGKSEQGAVWLDPKKTSPTAFYQFWVTSDDAAVEYYLKIYTEYTKEKIEQLMEEQKKQPQQRIAQFALADWITELVHGKEEAEKAARVTKILIGQQSLTDANEQTIAELKQQLPNTQVKIGDSLFTALADTGLAASRSQARQLLSDNAVYLNNQRATADSLKETDFINGYLLLRRGKAFKDSALLELR